MKYLIKLIVPVFLVFTAEPSDAMLMSTYAEQVWRPEVPVVDQQSGTSGVIQSQVGSYGGHINASAIAGSNGSLQVFLPEGQTWSDAHIHSVAQATWADTITNDTYESLNVAYDFMVDSLLTVMPIPYEHISKSSYSIDILVDDEVFWYSSVLLDSTYENSGEIYPADLNTTQPVITGEDLGGIFGSSKASYSVKNYVNSLSLATLLPGDSILLEVIVSASFITSEQYAQVGSSFLSLYGNYGFTPTEVPEPASMLLFSAAIAIFAGIHSFRRGYYFRQRKNARNNLNPFV